MPCALLFATIVSLGASLAMTALPAAERRQPENAQGIDWNKERQFWSFRPPTAKARPVVRNKQWPSQPLDYFVLARLEQTNLSPSPEADPRTLVRRVTFDLTGLPPTPEEVQAFLKDKRLDAYLRLAERLLASPGFGERLTSLWLPLARYAEDQAHQVGSDTTMFYPHAYRYREWVINAFNRDLPYDQFIRLQLAADKIDGDAKNIVALYARISRLKLNDLLMQFDYPDANVHAEKRSVTTTASQKLFMLNSPFMLSQARALAARLKANPAESDQARVQRAYRLLFGREPEGTELKLALEFLRKPGTPEMTRWEQYAQLLLASNEMLYVD